MKKAILIATTKGMNIISVLVREDMKVWFNFGTKLWFSFDEFSSLKNYKHIPQIKRYVESPSFKKNIRQTQKTIDKSTSYEDLAEHFYKDFKSDRNIHITKTNLILDDEIKGIGELGI
jgi:hypothetical protein